MTFCTIENKRKFQNKNWNELNTEIYTTQGCLNAARDAHDVYTSKGIVYSLYHVYMRTPERIEKNKKENK